MERIELITVCKTCGGHLVLDEEKRVCVCQSCGNSFDYEYMFGKDLLNDAKKTLSQKEFFSAYDMFNFYLDKDPNNKEAVVGLVLSAAQVSEFSQITANRLITNRIETDLGKFKDRYTGDMEKFVSYFEDSISLADKAREVTKKIKVVEESSSKYTKEIKTIRDKMGALYITNKQGEEMLPSEAIRNTGLVAIALSVMAVILGVTSLAPVDKGALGLILGVLVVLNLFIWVPLMISGVFDKNSQYKAYEKEIDRVSANLSAAKAPITELQAQYNTYRSEIQKNIFQMKMIIKD